MNFRIGITHGGSVCVLSDDLRFDFSPETAERLSLNLTSQIDRGDDLIFQTMQADQGRAFRFVGDHASAVQLRNDLNRGAAEARQIVAQADQDGAP